MDTSTKFQVDKIEFEQERTKVFQSLLKNLSLTDVTLVNDEDLEINAHKLILSSVSPVLRKIFERRPRDQPLLFLRGVKSEHLRALIDYIYTGEASIDVSDLNDFIQVGKDLKIVGLTDDDEEEDISAKQEDQAKDIVLEESSQNIIETFKGEPIIENESTLSRKAPGELRTLPNSLETIPEIDQVLVASARARMLTEEYFNVYERKKNSLMVQVKGLIWKCKRCPQEMKKHHLKEHVTIHMDGEFSYTCRYCGGHFNKCRTFQRHLTPCIVMAIQAKTLTHETVRQSPEQNYKTVSVQEYELMVDKHLRRSGEAPHYEWNCSLCGHTTKQKEMLIDHIESDHLHEFVFKCDTCGQTQSKYSVYKKHYKTCFRGERA